uniref:peptidylprolyl isomerase n=1 Tax=Pyramimonas obovata TaxID=1411642 RepID=A0A7S0N1U2_9CHLO|eukprot:CAMPEP_0118921772 /NCGR_PEP_ID=MMETSP1169-20130426/939_1 /TAXON_ID=36882 /ORGANISM="Pyramimonas obovata, Strain CCMP722" /LENGTH=253 /DNA_ID=CAMNT_0006862553 /DNA_START=46 /DNA_END=807 /DNA_ORIENTATION=-
MAAIASTFSSSIALNAVASHTQGRSNAARRMQPARSMVVSASARTVKNTGSQVEEAQEMPRRAFLSQTAMAAALAGIVGTDASPAFAAADSPLCNAECMKALEKIPMVTSPTGLQYKDIVVGTGPTPFPGVQVVADFVAMVKNGKNDELFIFQNTVASNSPQDIRVTGDPETANVIAGLDEGLITMKVGGIRRLYVPGDLAFPKGLASAPGRPRVAPNSDIIFDVYLRYIPGLEESDDDEDYVLDISSIGSDE